MTNIGLNPLAKCKGNLWYDWYAKTYKPKREWFKK